MPSIGRREGGVLPASSGPASEIVVSISSLAATACLFLRRHVRLYLQDRMGVVTADRTTSSSAGLEKYKAIESSAMSLSAPALISPVSPRRWSRGQRRSRNNLGAWFSRRKGQGRSVRSGRRVQGMVEASRRKVRPPGRGVNRVAPKIVDEVATRLRETMPEDVPAYVLPELTILAKPTVGEIARALNAEIISGGEET